MKPRVLDLDDQETWAHDFKEILFCDEVWPQIRSQLIDEDEGLEFLSQIKCGSEYLESALAKDLRATGGAIFDSAYTHVAAYHGCRPTNSNTY